MKLTLSRLIDLRDKCSDDPVVSLYLPTEAGDPATRTSWRLRADALLDELRTGLEGEDQVGIRTFDQARTLLVDAFKRRQTSPPPGTWVLLATPDKLILSHVTQETLPALARFDTGPRVAPLIGLPELRQEATVALLDVRRARLFKLEGAKLQEIIDLIPDHQLDDVSDLGVSKRAATASGMRGQTAKDQLQRAQSTETARFARRIAKAALDLAGSDGIILFGGSNRMGLAFASELEPRRRAFEVSALKVEMTDAQMRDALAGPLAEIDQSDGSVALAAVEASVGAEGRGCLGWNDTLRALHDASVQTLIVARDLIWDDPDRAEQVVGTALVQSADVVEVTGNTSRDLFDRHGGVGAMLRYAARVPAEPAGPDTSR